MNIATIILPVVDNRGNSTAGARDLAECKMVRAFGGFTTYPARGAWFNAETGYTLHEPVQKYEIAADWEDRKVVHNLCLIAEAFAVDADQDCVFVSVPGEVIFVKPQRNKHAA